jgi:xylulokinase
VETQALSLRLHSRWIGENMDPILVTGGASKNPGILRVLADVFQARIVPLQVSNSSALGGALRAAQAVDGTAWEELARRFSAPAEHLAVKPDPATRTVYEQAGRELERRLNEILV